MCVRFLVVVVVVAAVCVCAERIPARLGVFQNFYVTFMFDARSTWEWAYWIPLDERSQNPPSDISCTQYILQGCGCEK